MVHKQTVLLTLVLLLAVNCPLWAQKAFKGTIAYEIIYEDNSNDGKDKSLLPSTMEVTFSGNYSKTVFQGKGVSTILLANSQEKTTVVLLDVPGSRVALKPSKEEQELKLKGLPKVKITYPNSTRELMGFLCKKAIISYDSLTVTAWYAPDLGIISPNWQNELSTISGVLLDYTLVSSNGSKTRYIATNIKRTKVEESIFTIPQEYSILSKSEFDRLLAK